MLMLEQTFQSLISVKHNFKEVCLVIECNERTRLPKRAPSNEDMAESHVGACSSHFCDVHSTFMNIFRGAW